MKVSEQQIHLKDGRVATVKCSEASEAEAQIEHLFCLAAETDYTMRYPEERQQLTVDRERQFLKQIAASENELMLSAWVDGKLAGNCQIAFGNAIKTRHSARLAIGLKKAYWGLGLGKALMAKMEITARQRGIAVLELEYIEGNERARHLYEACGFTEYGRHPDAIRLKDGTRLALVGMQKYLSDGGTQHGI